VQQTGIRDLWTYRDRADLGSNAVDTHADLAGFSVEALDGSIGKVDEATYNVGESYIVVDTGPWIFGKKVMIPAGAITDVDLDDHRVYLDLTKEQVKNSPLIDENTAMDEDYRSRLGSYYETIYPPR
jgi:hypothetical protein